MAAALYSRKTITEVWVAPQPILLYMYLAQYFNGLFTTLAVRAGKRRVEAFMTGNTGYDSIQSVWGVLSTTTEKKSN